MKFIGISLQVLLVLLVVPTVGWADDVPLEPGMLIPKRDATLDGLEIKSTAPAQRSVLTKPAGAVAIPATAFVGVTKAGAAVSPQRGGDRQIAVLSRSELPVNDKNADYTKVLLNKLYGWRTTLSVSIEAPVSSKSANFGDMIEARLTQDFRFGNSLIAAKNSLVRGHVVSVVAPRTLSSAAMSHERKFNSRACMTIQFDEIVDLDGKRWPITATPCRQNNEVSNRSKAGRQVKVDAQGRIIRASATLSQNQKTAYNTTKVATMLPLPTTVLINALGVPAAMSVVGAASPSVAFNKPVDASDSHARARGAAYAFVTNLPGAFFVQSVVEKGDQVELLPGDEIVLDLAIRESGYRFPVSATALNVTGAVVTTNTGRRLYPIEPPAAQHSAFMRVASNDDHLPTGLVPAGGRPAITPANTPANTPATASAMTPATISNTTSNTTFSSETSGAR